MGIYYLNSCLKNIITFFNDNKKDRTVGYVMKTHLNNWIKTENISKKKSCIKLNVINAFLCLYKMRIISVNITS